MKRGRRLHRFIENLVIGLAVLLFGAIVFEGIRRLPGAAAPGASGPASPTRPSGPPPYQPPPYQTPAHRTPPLEGSLPPGAAPFGMSRTMPAPASLPAIGLSDSRRRKAKPADIPAPGQ